VTALPDVIVVGGGAIGAACARELALVGRRVLVLDRGRDQGDAWRAAGGMLAPQIEAGVEDPLLEFGLAGRERYHEIAAPLRESTGIDIGLWPVGIVRLATNDSEVTELKSKVAWQRQQGHVCDWFDADEVRSNWPWLGEAHGALWAPKEAALDPNRLVAALLADAQRHGAQVISDEVVSVDRKGDRIVGVTGKDQYKGGEVIIAAGAWSGRIKGLPRPLSVEPVRGQMAALPWPAELKPAIVVGAGGYLIARESEAIVGSTMEYAGFEVEVTSGGLARIFAAATHLCPALAKVEVTRTWAGLRPVTPDGLPIIGREPLVEGLWYATGHGRNGILLAAITGVTMARLLSGDQDIEDLESVRPDRFWSW
jgi:glycine oxidase